MEKEIEEKKIAKKEEKAKAKQADSKAQGDQGAEVIVSSDSDDEDGENDLDELEGEIKKRIFKETS